MFTTETGIGVVVMVVLAAFWLAFMLWEDWGQAGKTEMPPTITRNGAISPTA